MRVGEDMPGLNAGLLCDLSGLVRVCFFQDLAWPVPSIIFAWNWKESSSTMIQFLASLPDGWHAHFVRLFFQSCQAYLQRVKSMVQRELSMYSVTISSNLEAVSIFGLHVWYCTDLLTMTSGSIIVASVDNWAWSLFFFRCTLFIKPFWN